MGDKENIIRTFTELTPHYEEVVDSELSRFWGWRYKKFVENFLKQVSFGKGDTILDVATGTGEIPLNMINNGALQERIHGLDITLSMLKRSKVRLSNSQGQSKVNLTCASGMEMPYKNESFDVVTCALATHHMEVETLISEIHRILNREGRLSIADAVGSNYLQLPGIKFILRLAAFVYFLFKETINRAWAEARAISNIRNIGEWNDILHNTGFREIKITKLKSKYFWIPGPIIIQAKKIMGEEK